MDTRIYELAAQSGFSSWELSPSKETMSDTPEKIEKFAELIVQECISLMEKERANYANTSPYQDREYYERMDAKENAFDDAKDIIKYHFGVK
jgi:hypothetical protein